MPRTEYPVTEDADTLRACSRGALCVWKEPGEATHPLPRTLEYFPKDSWMRDGMSVRCKRCASEATMASRRRKTMRDRKAADAE